METLNWPPPYTLTKSARAKRLSLKISERKGLQIIVPRSVSEKRALAFLDEKRDWIAKHLPAALAEQAKRAAAPLPTEIKLLAIDAHYKLVYMPQQSPLRLIERAGCEWVLWGRIDDEALVIQKIKRWLCVLAERVFYQECRQLATLMDVEFKKIGVRGQQTLWGSCTRDKVINLNYKLLFLPYALMRHVLIHELAHTVHLNHGKQFWALVAKYDAQYKWHNRQLKEAMALMPTWVE
jgi:predicted metal-dependent hydrolase